MVYESNYPGGVISSPVGFHLSYFMSLSDIARKVKSFADVDMHDAVFGFDTDINAHIRNCMSDHLDLFNRQDEISKAWYGAEELDAAVIEEKWPIGHEKISSDLELLQMS